jgi:hypothetical protein
MPRWPERPLQGTAAARANGCTPQGGVAKGADDGACRGCRWEPTGPNVWSDGIAANQDSRLGMYSLR